MGLFPQTSQTIDIARYLKSKQSFYHSAPSGVKLACGQNRDSVKVETIQLGTASVTLEVIVVGYN